MPLPKAKPGQKYLQFCEIPPPDDFIPEASKLWTTTPEYIKKARNSAQHHRAQVELYDLHTDPFETTNLAGDHHRGNYAEIIREIRAWAEAEIGRPPPAVVGHWNLAYDSMLKAAYHKLKLNPMLVKSRDWPVATDLLTLVFEVHSLQYS